MHIQLPATVAFLAAVVAVAYIASRSKLKRDKFTIIDGMIIFAIMSTVAALAIPFLNAANEHAENSAVLHSLRSFRGQIELYKIEHSGNLPLVYKETFPQLIFSTNRKGETGPNGKNYPFGPYFHHDIPVNPRTDISTVTLMHEYPPKKASGVGGWLYNQETGKIVPDLDKYLEK